MDSAHSYVWHHRVCRVENGQESWPPQIFDMLAEATQCAHGVAKTGEGILTIKRMNHRRRGLRSERWRRAHGIGPRRPAQKP